MGRPVPPYRLGASTFGPGGRFAAYHTLRIAGALPAIDSYDFCSHPAWWTSLLSCATSALLLAYHPARDRFSRMPVKSDGTRIGIVSLVLADGFLVASGASDCLAPSPLHRILCFAAAVSAGFASSCPRLGPSACWCRRPDAFTGEDDCFPSSYLACRILLFEVWTSSCRAHCTAILASFCTLLRRPSRRYCCCLVGFASSHPSRLASAFCQASFAASSSRCTSLAAWFLRSDAGAPSCDSFLSGPASHVFCFLGCGLCRCFFLARLR